MTAIKTSESRLGMDGIPLEVINKKRDEMIQCHC